MAIFQAQILARVSMSYIFLLTWLKRQLNWLAFPAEFASVEIRILSETSHSNWVIFSDNCPYLFIPWTESAQILNLEFTFDLDYDSTKNSKKSGYPKNYPVIIRIVMTVFWILVKGLTIFVFVIFQNSVPNPENPATIRKY